MPEDSMQFDDSFKPNVLLLDKTEVKNLYDYFMSVGYISHEFHADIHKIINRLEKFLE